MKGKIDRRVLEGIYRQYNRQEMISPDPLEFVHRYEDPADREVVALVASSLAYGRVAQILKSLELIFDIVKSPARYACDGRPSRLKKQFSGFKHRWTTGDQVAALFLGAGQMIRNHGSLLSAFEKNYRESDVDFLPALGPWVAQINADGGGLVADPCGASACKRLHLMLRWLVRKDDVDPGGWDKLPSSKLLMPTDTHILRIGKALKFTERKVGDLKAAKEITAGFAAINSEDPVKYDFALTRFGIRQELDLGAWLESQLK